MSDVSSGAITPFLDNGGQEVKAEGQTVAGLPAAASNQGVFAYVTAATTAFGTSIGSAVTGGGSNIVAVFSNGTNWLIL